jgi:hypothetical protein
LTVPGTTDTPISASLHVRRSPPEPRGTRGPAPRHRRAARPAGAILDDPTGANLTRSFAVSETCTPASSKGSNVEPEPPLVRFARAGGQVGQADDHIDGTQDDVIRAALRTIHLALGTEYLKRQIDADKSNGYLLLDGPEDHRDDDETALLRTERLLLLARELRDAQAIPGFAALRVELQKRSMYDAVAEMRAVNHMRRRSDDLEFIDPNAGGPTYDAAMIFNGVRVAVEVKAKAAKTVNEYQPDLIARSLKRARQQLPPSGPSLIYLQLTSPWTEDVDVMSSVDHTICHWLKNTSRVNGVVVLTERRFPLPTGGSRLTQASAYIPNLTPRTAVEGLND